MPGPERLKAGAEAAVRIFCSDEGVGGTAPERVAMLLAGLLYACDAQGIDWDDVLDQAEAFVDKNPLTAEGDTVDDEEDEGEEDEDEEDEDEEGDEEDEEGDDEDYDEEDEDEPDEEDEDEPDEEDED
jgi:hypothetical protein